MQQITQLKKVLVANRGEIAVRIFRACYDLGLHTVAIYSNEDTYSLFRTKADEAYLVGEKKSPLGAYLDIPGIISLAKRRGVTAIHPGYGFLSENADFARACEDNGILFVGPSSDVLAKMGDKLSAKEIAVKCGVPIIPGCTEPLKDADDALDTLIFEGLRSRSVALRSRKSGRGVRVSFDGFPMLAFWTMPGKKAPYLCIEPWHGCAAGTAEGPEFTDKAHCIVLAPGESRTLAYRADTL